MADKQLVDVFFWGNHDGVFSKDMTWLMSFSVVNLYVVFGKDMGYLCGKRNNVFSKDMAYFTVVYLMQT